MLQPRILYMFLLCTLFSFFSCSSDDDDITGTYKITSFSSVGCSDPIDNFSFDFSANDGCTMFLGEEVCGDGTLTLSADNSFSFTLTVTAAGQSFTQNGSGSYSIDGNTITICDGGVCETSTFTLGSGQITIKFSEESDPCVLTMSGEKI